MTTALGMSENLLIPGQRLGFEDVEAGAGNPPIPTQSIRVDDGGARSERRRRSIPG